ncbi:MAG: CAP domain-containing protein [Cellulomonas sp.]|uniref:CAP domain-containing protein n=1 Tax=Cellulomonas sp. TaxID=40001 RepID=UPI001A0DD91C|nr:CAP domain-containing protein [Cellulomonas sp.]MBF0689107.1 CAP domain-containing protein [Cellulomonas sp.]
MRALVVAVVLAAVPACSTPPSPDPAGLPTSGTASSVALEPDLYAAALVEDTNATRVADGLPALEVSACAAQAAERRAADLVGVAELTHAPLDDVIQGCDAPRTAENLSRASAPPADVVEAWLASPGHRDNLLDPDLRHVGVACVPDGPALLCSQVFLGP